MLFIQSSRDGLCSLDTSCYGYVPITTARKWIYENNYTGLHDTGENIDTKENVTCDYLEVAID